MSDRDAAAEVNTGSAGAIFFRYLKDGTYTIEEISAPAGYDRLLCELTFTPEDGRIALCIQTDSRWIQTDLTYLPPGKPGGFC